MPLFYISKRKFIKSAKNRIFTFFWLNRLNCTVFCLYFEVPIYLTLFKVDLWHSYNINYSYTISLSTVGLITIRTRSYDPFTPIDQRASKTTNNKRLSQDLFEKSFNPSHPQVSFHKAFLLQQSIGLKFSYVTMQYLKKYYEALDEVSWHFFSAL